FLRAGGISGPRSVSTMRETQVASTVGEQLLGDRIEQEEGTQAAPGGLEHARHFSQVALYGGGAHVREDGREQHYIESAVVIGEGKLLRRATARWVVQRVMHVGELEMKMREARRNLLPAPGNAIGHDIETVIASRAVQVAGERNGN